MKNDIKADDILITAIIKNKGNTLTVELPQSVMDLEMKLSSIGSELSRDIHISDDPKSRITVKLISEGDIGEHLKKLFDSSHTLRDVNSLMHTIANASDEVLEAIGSDIINDRYVSPKKLADDIEKLKYETGQFTETLYFPLLGRIYDEVREVFAVGAFFHEFGFQKKMQFRFASKLSFSIIMVEAQNL